VTEQSIHASVKAKPTVLPIRQVVWPHLDTQTPKLLQIPLFEQPGERFPPFLARQHHDAAVAEIHQLPQCQRCGGWFKGRHTGHRKPVLPTIHRKGGHLLGREPFKYRPRPRADHPGISAGYLHQFRHTVHIKPQIHHCFRDDAYLMAALFKPMPQSRREFVVCIALLV
jgi:hypothetical protein